MHTYFYFKATTLFFSAYLLFNNASAIAADGKIKKKDLIQTAVCKKIQKKKVSKADVYKTTPFKAGEQSVFEVYYGSIYVGDAQLLVKPAYKYKNDWHFMFDLHGKTGDWYSGIFKAEDSARAIARAGDFGAAWFFLDQNEKRIFDDPRLKEKYLTFEPEKCKVSLRTVTTKKGKKIEKQEKPNAYHASAMDALTAAFKLRTHRYNMGSTVREPVYTSRKNWWLDAKPVAIEMLSVGAGKFKTVKLKLQTYAGEDLQQKGDVYLWIAIAHPSKPIVKIAGDVKIGMITATLKSFKAGKI